MSLRREGQHEAIGRGVAIALAIVGAIAVFGFGMVVFQGAPGDSNGSESGLCRNPDFDPHDPNSTEFIPCEEDPARPFDTKADKPTR